MQRLNRGLSGDLPQHDQNESNYATKTQEFIMKSEKLYRSDKEVAQMLGHDIRWFRSNVNALERQYGFPSIDPAVGLPYIPSIEAWATERNTRTMHNNSEQLMKSSNKDNLDGF